MLVWRNYITDMGRAYPLFALSMTQENEVSTNIDPLDLLPSDDKNQIIEVKHSCVVTGLTPRKIRIFAVDGARFLINYYQPFNQVLVDYLVSHLSISAYELIGERIKYGRLKRMLDNV
ncbi:MAG: hypothetical protein QNJ49_09730 [Mastigocoleus sp. MO_167.B18]|nr:hypothetical protein [Mastigocoleus sp. MO_167.B18]